MILQATRDLHKVALWLGHAEIQTMEMYLRPDLTDKLDALAAVGSSDAAARATKSSDALIATLKPA